MTEEQRRLCRDLVIFPNGRSRITKEEFLHRFPAAVEHGRSALKWLQEAYETRNADDLEYALTIGFAFGFASEWRHKFPGRQCWKRNLGRISLIYPDGAARKKGPYNMLCFSHGEYNTIIGRRNRKQILKLLNSRQLRHCLNQITL